MNSEEDVIYSIHAQSCLILLCKFGKSPNNKLVPNCKYCNSLSKAFDGQNYCSQAGDAITDVSTNAYYFKADTLDSGNHISRFSIRTISTGYQNFKINETDYILDQESYLTIPTGAEFSSHVRAEQPLEGFLVAYSDEDVSEYAGSASTAGADLFDQEINSESLDDLLNLPQKNQLHSHQKIVLSQLKGLVNARFFDRLLYEELFKDLLDSTMKRQQQLDRKLLSLSTKKKSTRMELKRRLERGREYIDGNLAKDISLKDISHVAALSEFHFLRSFKSVYEITPHKYVTLKRLQKAKYLLSCSNKDLDQILMEIGFQNKSSFIRMFKRYIGMTPVQYRQA